MAHDEHNNHHINYLYVFFALCGFTAMSVAFDGLPDTVPHSVTIVLVLAVAVAKALCVMMFFMHLKFEGNWKYVLLAPTTILAIGLPLALYPDVGVAYYTPTAPQQEWKEEMDEHKAHHGHAEEDEHTAPDESLGEPAGLEELEGDAPSDEEQPAESKTAA